MLVRFNVKAENVEKASEVIIDTVRLLDLVDKTYEKNGTREFDITLTHLKVAAYDFYSKYMSNDLGKNDFKKVIDNFLNEVEYVPADKDKWIGWRSRETFDDFKDYIYGYVTGLKLSHN